MACRCPRSTRRRLAGAYGRERCAALTRAVERSNRRECRRGRTEQRTGVSRPLCQSKLVMPESADNIRTMATTATIRSSFNKLFDEIGTVDQVGIEERVAKFTTRSIKKGSKVWGLKTAVSMVDLTTLEGKDTPGKVASLCQKARRPSADPDIPPVAAVCIYPFLVKYAARWLADTPIKVASVATAFPSGQSPLELRLEEVRTAVGDGADEIDMVINRGLFLAGEFSAVQDEISAVVEACGDAQLKVILEVSELDTYDNVRAASFLAMQVIRPGDFIKTSTEIGRAHV